MPECNNAFETSEDPEHGRTPATVCASSEDSAARAHDVVFIMRDPHV